MRCKLIFRRGHDGVLRVLRLMWDRGTVGDGKGYSCKFTIGFFPCAFRWQRDSDGWRLWLLGLRVHFERSYGGIYV